MAMYYTMGATQGLTKTRARQPNQYSSAGVVLPLLWRSTLGARKRYEAVNAIILAMVGRESSAISRQYSASERQRALTSAMEAALPDHVCSMEEILALLWE
jgi:hypothetical protein